MGGLDSDEEGRVPICVAADALVFMAGINQEFLVRSLESAFCWQWGPGEATHRYLDKPQLCSEVERGIAIICEVGVLQALWVVLDYSFEECKVFQMDSPADAKGDVNPE